MLSRPVVFEVPGLEVEVVMVGVEVEEYVDSAQGEEPVEATVLQSNGNPRAYILKLFIN